MRSVGSMKVYSQEIIYEKDWYKEIESEKEIEENVSGNQDPP
jgi:hypothetical protein